MRTIPFAIALAASLFLACADETGAEDVAKQFYQSLNSGESRWACEHFQPCGSPMFFNTDMDRIGNGLVGKIANVDAQVTSSDDAVAEVRVRLQLNGASRTGAVRMIRHNGVWKIRDGSGLRLVGVNTWGI